RRGFFGLGAALGAASAPAWAGAGGKKKKMGGTPGRRLRKNAFAWPRRKFSPQAGKPAHPRGAVYFVPRTRRATGPLRAPASNRQPTYNPNAMDQDTVEAIYNPNTRAANDRARFEIYPPGSTFKLITAAAALETFGTRALGHEYEFFCGHTNYIPWYVGRTR